MEKWKSQTLENLEKNNWPALVEDEASYLAITCHRLRKKPLVDFSVEDLRIMIGQNIGLKYLVPIAIELLDDNILAEGDLYEGDLLTAVLSSDVGFWKNNETNAGVFLEIFRRNQSTLKSFDTTWEIKKNWFELFKEFENSI